MIAWHGQDQPEVEVRERDTPYGAAALALVLGIAIGLILADAVIYNDESPATADAVTGLSTGVAAPVVRGVERVNLPRNER